MRWQFQTPITYYDLFHMRCRVVFSLWLTFCIGNFGIPNLCICCLRPCRICALAFGCDYALAVQHLSYGECTHSFSFAMSHHLVYAATLWSICSAVWCLAPLVGTVHWQSSAWTLLDVLSYLCPSVWLSLCVGSFKHQSHIMICFTCAVVWCSAFGWHFALAILAYQIYVSAVWGPVVFVL